MVEAEAIDPVMATVLDGTVDEAASTGTGAIIEGRLSIPASRPGTRHRGRRSGPMASDQPLARAEPRDAPYCYQCGNAMQRAGSCYVCGSCGTTSGCS